MSSTMRTFFRWELEPLEQEFVGKCRKSHGFILIYFIPLIGLTAHHHILHPRRRDGERRSRSMLNFSDHPDHIARSDQPRLRAAHRRGAAAFAFQPAIDKAEVLAAVINLSVIELDKRPSLSRGHVFLAPVAGASRPVDGSIGGVIHAEQQHLPIQFIYPANRAVNPCGHPPGAGR